MKRACLLVRGFAGVQGLRIRQTEQAVDGIRFDLFSVCRASHAVRVFGVHCWADEFGTLRSGVVLRVVEGDEGTSSAVIIRLYGSLAVLSLILWR